MKAKMPKSFAAASAPKPLVIVPPAPTDKIDRTLLRAVLREHYRWTSAQITDLERTIDRAARRV